MGAGVSAGPTGDAHFGIVCDGCQMSPLRGVRHKCMICADYDLCDACNSTRSSIHQPTHRFRHLAVPAPQRMPMDMFMLQTSQAGDEPLSPLRGQSDEAAEVQVRQLRRLFEELQLLRLLLDTHAAERSAQETHGRGGPVADHVLQSLPVLPFPETPLQTPAQTPPREEGAVGTVEAAALSSIPSFRALEIAECCICMDSFERGDPVLHLPCAHAFHQPCIKKWFTGHHTCPSCRHRLEPSSHDTAYHGAMQGEADDEEGGPVRDEDRGGHSALSVEASLGDSDNESLSADQVSPFTGASIRRARTELTQSRRAGGLSLLGSRLGIPSIRASLISRLGSPARPPPSD
eukprot:CAMPEP_0172649018 /NCGR_PEP_ID=MMETSP1068-20121228/241575_1 /TAXON_ID=35684 /ORGANISM="Pseudopedinella elastica, Strain CCMP716" /LENGTH=346 /DNA_ID=CAMNT_0013463363 /DNA_START=163 /DNA_END=1203 /DNA_ORIENTATION=-